MPLYRHCPQCGGPIEPVREDAVVQHYDCAACGFRFYSNPAPTATAVIENDRGEILLTRRIIDPFRDHWDLPGGYVKNGESARDALVRELREELDIAVDIGALIGVFPDTYGDPDTHTFNLFYRAHYRGGAIRPGDDVGDYRWTRPDALPAQMAFHCVPRAIAAYRELIRHD